MIRVILSSKNRQLVLVTIGALLVYIIFLSALPASWSENQSTDYLTFYAPVAHNLLADSGLVTSDGALAVRYPPGFPLILAGLFGLAQWIGWGDTAILTIFIGLCVMLSNLLVYSIAKLIAGEKVAMLSALGWMTYPFYLWLTKQPNSELPFLPVFLCAVYLFLRASTAERPRWQLMLAAGVMIGTAALIRPVALALSATFFLALWLPKIQQRFGVQLLFCGLLLLGNLLVVAPWEVWVWGRSTQWIPLSTGGPPSILDGLTIGVKSSASGVVTGVPEDVRSLMLDVAAHRRELRSTGDIGRFMIQAFLDRPLAVGKLVVVKAARAWYATDAQWLEKYIIVIQLPYLLLSGIGAYIAWRRSENSRRFTVVALLMVLYFWAMTIATLSILRYMIPAMMLLMIFIAIAITTFLEWWQDLLGRRSHLQRASQGELSH